MKKLAVWALGALFVAGCAKTEQTTTDSGLVKSNFRTEVNGKKTDLYVLRNQNNMEVCVTKILQKSGIQKNEVIELIYRGFI